MINFACTYSDGQKFFFPFFLNLTSRVFFFETEGFFEQEIVKLLIESNRFYNFLFHPNL